MPSPVAQVLPPQWSCLTRDAGFGPYPPLGGCMVNVKDGLVLLGGDPYGPGAAHAFSSTDGVVWKPVAAPWTPRRYAAAASIGHNGIVMFGGKRFDGKVLDETWYTPLGDQWVQISKEHAGPWPAARSGASLINVGGALWLFGGCDDNTYFNDVWMSMNGGCTWKQVTDHARWKGRSDACACWSEDRFWLLGGFTGEIAPDDMWLSADGKEWFPFAPQRWRPRYGASYARITTNCLIGGSTGEAASEKEAWIDDGHMAVWTEVDGSALPSGIMSAACAVRDNRAYITGGTLENQVWCLAPR